jgi:hypothetical protein
MAQSVVIHVSCRVVPHVIKRNIANELDRLNLRPEKVAKSLPPDKSSRGGIRITLSSPLAICEGRMNRATVKQATLEIDSLFVK